MLSGVYMLSSAVSLSGLKRVLSLQTCSACDTDGCANGKTDRCLGGSNGMQCCSGTHSEIRLKHPESVKDCALPYRSTKLANEEEIPFPTTYSYTRTRGFPFLRSKRPFLTIQNGARGNRDTTMTRTPAHLAEEKTR